MTKNQSLFVRFMLFLIGAGIIIFVFFLSTGDRELNRTDAFVWTSIGLMYLIFFLPFFFSAINIVNFSKKIPALSMVWFGIILYTLASTGIILLMASVKIISLNTTIIIQAVLLFLFLIDVYFAYFASTHVGNVAAEEAAKKQYLSQIKSKAQVLSLSTNKLPQEYDNAQNLLKRALDDIKYIYPINNSAGDDLESRILQSLGALSQLCGGISTGADCTALEGEAANLQTLINERKLLRN